jgi:hypothetical protein
VPAVGAGTTSPAAGAAEPSMVLALAWPASRAMPTSAYIKIQYVTVQYSTVQYSRREWWNVGEFLKADVM